MTQPADRRVIVSGAGGTLGRAIVADFAAKGWSVLALDRNVEPLADIPGVTARAVDLLIEEDIRQVLTEAVPATEPIALLVNAVGLIWNEPILSLRGAKFATHQLQSFRQVIDANLTATFVTATQVAARMARRGGGSIINFSSIAGEGNAGQAAYAAAKAGIEGLTHTMAIELGPLGIRVNALALGFIDVPTTRAAVAEERLKAYLQRTPVGRLGQVEDVIGAIEFLADSSFSNGTVMKLDGGLRL
jgi:3-oxoacyl-[acyl-carrier protein] reductase